MIRVVEIFGPTVQGEGNLIGRPTVFVRTGGCDYRCSWCDTPQAVLSENRHLWTPMEVEEIADEVNRLSKRPTLVTLSGGNPALQDCGKLVQWLQDEGHEVAVETQGSIAAPWLANVDHLIVSPKPPSSGMETDWDVLLDVIQLRLENTITLKVVVANDADFEYAREVYVAAKDITFPEGGEGDYFVLQPCNETYEPTLPFDLEASLRKLEWLCGKVIAEGWNDVRVLPQMHTLLWGNKVGV